MFEGMGSFIISREKLINVIEEYTARGNFSFKRDYIQRQFNLGELSINVYEFFNEVLWNLCIADYFKNNLSLIDEEVSNAIFRQDAPIYTKVHDEVPAYYGMDSEVADCSIADGCVIEGKVEHSVLSRNVKICKGAVVKNAIIMQDSVVGENAILDNVIVDKSNTITPYTWLYSSADNPLIIQKGETV